MCKKYFLSAFAVASLASCGGTSVVTFEDLENEGQALQDQYEDQILSFDYSDPDTIPTSGSARYDGVVGVTIGRPVDVINGEVDALGRVSLTADLGTDAITGSMDNFVAADSEDPVDGSLAIEARCFRDVDLEEDYGIEGSVEGRLRDDGDTLDVAGELYADFFGEEGAFIYGFAEGEVELTDDSGSALDFFEAEFLAD